MDYRSLSFPKNSCFLVTGGAGFIGSNLCEAILGMGYHVRCLDNLSTGYLKNIEPFLVDPNFSFIKGDITDFNICLEACKNICLLYTSGSCGDYTFLIPCSKRHRSG